MSQKHERTYLAFSKLTPQNRQRKQRRQSYSITKHRKTQTIQDRTTLQLKIQLLFSRLNKKRTNISNAPLQKTINNISKSKMNKMTFSNQIRQHNQLDKLREIKQKMQNEFQFQFEILTANYKEITNAHHHFQVQKIDKSQIIESEITNIVSMLQKMKEMALSLTLSRKTLKMYTHIISKKESHKRNNPSHTQTPFRLSLTPFQKDNSLLISVKRSLQGIGAYNTTMKRSQKDGQQFEQYKSYENLPNLASNPSMKNYEHREKVSSFKDLIKETQQQERDVSFNVLEKSIMQRLHMGQQNRQKSLQKSRQRIESYTIIIENLTEEISEEGKRYQNQWNKIQNELKVQFGNIKDVIDQYRSNSLSLDRQREEIYILMKNSIQDILISQRRAYKQDHSIIIQNLHEVISIFQ